jgi:SAM-dependent methyltransferase
MKTREDKKRIDDKKYWKNRHNEVNSLEASGLQAVGLRANYYIYKILAEQYLRLLNTLDTKNIKSVLDCGYGDGYFLEFYRHNFPKIALDGIDISSDAKKKINFMEKSRLHVGDLSNFSLRKKFDIVHSFDVLYHVLDDQDYFDSLNNMTKHSNKYIILHERFFDKTPIITSKHVKMRRRDITDQFLNTHGFHLVAEMPTHFIGMRIPTFKLNAIIPKTLYRIDSFIANNFSRSFQDRLCSHKVRVYEKAT